MQRCPRNLDLEIFTLKLYHAHLSTVIHDDDLKTFLEAEPFQTIRGIAEEFNINPVVVIDGFKGHWQGEKGVFPND